MADSKITDKALKATLSGNEELPLNDGGNDRKTTTLAIANLATQNTTYDSLTDTPSTKLGSAGKVIAVSEDEQNHEYVDIPTTIQYQFDTAIDDADPGDGKFRYDNATQSSATFIYINDTEFGGGILEDILLSLGIGSKIKIQCNINRLKYVVINIESIESASGYIKLGITFDRKGTDFDSGDIVILTIINLPAVDISALQTKADLPVLKWKYNTNTDTDPGAGYFNYGSGFLNISTTAFGTNDDMSFLLLILKQSAAISIQDSDDINNSLFVTLSDLPTSESGYVHFDVTIRASGGTLTNDAVFGFTFLNAIPEGQTWPVPTSIFQLVDYTDVSKSMSVDLSGVTTSENRILTIQDKNITVAGLDDLDDYQTSLSLPFMRWQYNTNTDTDPGAAKFNYGSGFLNIANGGYATGSTTTSWLSKIKNGAGIRMQDQADESNFILLTATADGVAESGYYHFAVTENDSDGTMTLDTVWVLEVLQNPIVVLPIMSAASDEDSDLISDTSVLTYRMPFAATLVDVRGSVKTAPTGLGLVIDINESGTSVLSTKLTIDIGEKTSTTAATAVVISDNALADDAEITIDIDQIGSTVAGAGLKIYLYVIPS